MTTGILISILVCYIVIVIDKLFTKKNKRLVIVALTSYFSAVATILVGALSSKLSFLEEFGVTPAAIWLFWLAVAIPIGIVSGYLLLRQHVGKAFPVSFIANFVAYLVALALAAFIPFFVLTTVVMPLVFVLLFLLLSWYLNKSSIGVPLVLAIIGVACFSLFIYIVANSINSL